MEKTESSLKELKNSAVVCTQNIVLPVHWDFIFVDDAPISTKYFFSEDYIGKQLQPEYWRDCSIYNANDKRLQSNDFLIASCITEYQLIRELIWVLHGTRESFLFFINVDLEDIFHVSFEVREVFLSHVSKSTLKVFLNVFAQSAQKVFVLREFIRRIFCVKDNGFSDCIMLFGQCVHTFLSHFDKCLLELEKNSRGPSSFTLLNLYTKLIPWFRRTRILSDIILNFTEGHLDTLNLNRTTSSLLSILYHHSLNPDYCNDYFIMRFIFFTFLLSFKPFLLTLVQLLSCSKFCVSVVSKPYFKRDDLYFFDANAVLLPKNLEDIFGFDLSFMFQYVLSDISYIVKLIVILYRYCDLLGNTTLFDEIAIDYREVITRFTLAFGFDFKYEMLERFLVDPHSDLDQHLGFNQVRSLALLESTVNHFVGERSNVINKQILKVLLHIPSPVSLKVRNLGVAFALISDIYLFGSGYQMNNLVYNFFACTFLKSKRQNLFDFIYNLRSQFSGVTSPLFQQELMFLSFNFEAAIDEVGFSNVNKILESIKLTYQTDWPLNMFFDEQSLEMYNKVFVLILQIKYAKWNLENLRFNEVDNRRISDEDFCHNLFILRMNMMYLFNSLHDFILHEIGVMKFNFMKQWNFSDFNTAVERYPDYDGLKLSDLFTDHRRLLSDLQSLCLLTDSAVVLRNEIGVFCDMVNKLRCLWLNDSCFCNLPKVFISMDIFQLSHKFYEHIKLFLSAFSSIRFSNTKHPFSLFKLFEFIDLFLNK